MSPICVMDACLIYDIGRTKGVIFCSFVGITKNLVCLDESLKVAFRVRTGVSIGVDVLCAAPKCFLYRSDACIRVDAQTIVESPRVTSGHLV